MNNATQNVSASTKVQSCKPCQVRAITTHGPWKPCVFTETMEFPISGQLIESHEDEIDTGCATISRLVALADRHPEFEIRTPGSRVVFLPNIMTFQEMEGAFDLETAWQITNPRYPTGLVVAWDAEYDGQMVLSSIAFAANAQRTYIATDKTILRWIEAQEREDAKDGGTPTFAASQTLLREPALLVWSNEVPHADLHGYSYSKIWETRGIKRPEERHLQVADIVGGDVEAKIRALYDDADQHRFALVEEQRHYSTSIGYKSMMTVVEFATFVRENEARLRLVERMDFVPYQQYS